MIPSSACRWQTDQPGHAGVRAGSASYTTPRDTIDRLEEGGRRERWVSAATVVSFAIADRAVKLGCPARIAGQLGLDFVHTAGGGGGGWVGELPDPRRPTRLPGQLFTCTDPDVAVETWAAYPGGDAPGRIIPVVAGEDGLLRLYPEIAGSSGSLFLVPLDELVIGTLLRCQQAPRKAPPPLVELEHKEAAGV